MATNECRRECAEPDCFCVQQREIALADLLSAVNPLRAALFAAVSKDLPADWQARWERHQAALGIQLDMPSLTLCAHYLDAAAGACRTFSGPLTELAPADLARDLAEAAGPFLTTLLNGLPLRSRKALAVAMEAERAELTVSVYDGCGACLVDVHTLSVQSPVHIARVFVPGPVFETAH